MSQSFAFYLGALAGIFVSAAFVYWWLRRNTYRRQVDRVIRKISKESLKNVVIPDGVDGEIHLDHLLLTDVGFLVIDIKELKGRLFGGDNMDEWTVIHESQRFTFANPAGPLRERVIAVKTLLKDVPVDGKVVIVGETELSEGLPDCVVSLDQLGQQFGSLDKTNRTNVNAFYPYWDRLRQIAISN